MSFPTKRARCGSEGLEPSSLSVVITIRATFTVKLHIDFVETESLG